MAETTVTEHGSTTARTNTEAPYIPHVDDVVSYFKACSDAFGHLEAILASIQRTTGQSFDAGDLAKLAGAGMYIATDYENLADCWREEVQRHGVRHG